MSERNESGCDVGYVIRACCGAARNGRRAGFIEPEGMAEADSSADREVGGGDVLERGATFERSPRFAAHEAGHAIIAILHGASVPEVRVDPPTRANCDAAKLRSARARVAIYQAGFVAEKWADRIIARLEDDIWRKHVELMRADLAGRCDACQAVRWTMFETGYDAPDAVVFAAIRDVEAEVIGMITSRPVSAAIRRLANLLMEQGVVDEDGVWICLGEDLTSSRWPKVCEEERGESTWDF